MYSLNSAALEREWSGAPADLGNRFFTLLFLCSLFCFFFSPRGDVVGFVSREAGVPKGLNNREGEKKDGKNMNT